MRAASAADVLPRLPRRRGPAEPRSSRTAGGDTGDRAYRDDDGRLWFQGRADDVIISAGYRIGPVEVESALGSHPAVLEAAAIARPDAERGARRARGRGAAAGSVPSQALTTELQTHCKRVASPIKYPRSIAYATSLPKTESGKILRAQLRDQLVVQS